MGTLNQRLAMARLALEARAEELAGSGEGALAEKFAAYAHAVALTMADPRDMGLLSIARADAVAVLRQLDATDPTGKPARYMREAMVLIADLLGPSDAAN